MAPGNGIVAAARKRRDGDIRVSRFRKIREKSPPINFGIHGVLAFCAVDMGKARFSGTSQIQVVHHVLGQYPASSAPDDTQRGVSPALAGELGGAAANGA